MHSHGKRREIRGISRDEKGQSKIAVEREGGEGGAAARDGLVNQVEEAIEIRDPGATNSRGSRYLARNCLARPRFFLFSLSSFYFSRRESGSALIKGGTITNRDPLACSFKQNRVVPCQREVTQLLTKCCFAFNILCAIFLRVRGNFVKMFTREICTRVNY